MKIKSNVKAGRITANHNQTLVRALKIKSVITSLITLGLVGGAVLTALAFPRPFHLVEHGKVTVDNEGHLVADGTGTATHLGRFTLHREATLKPMGSEVKVEDGQATLTAANGDQFEATFTGTINPATGQGVLVYEWKGSTGRFQNASGPTIWHVKLHPDQGTYDVVAYGVINY